MNEGRVALRSSRVLLPSGLKPAFVEIEGGKITRIIETSDSNSHRGTTDFGNFVIMPGIVDTHAHINEPGRTDWEGFVTATRAAGAGGITTVIDMPLNSIPATTSVQALEAKARSAAGKCSIDYGFWGGIVPENAGNPREIEEMIRQGVMGFKAFLCPSGVDEFPMCGEMELRQAMPVLARSGVPLLVHAELESSLHPASQSSHDPRDYRTYLDSRPPEWEIRAIRKMIALAAETGCKVHIVHLSAAEALSDLCEARAQGVRITAETCPHYLHFDAERITNGATPYKCAPPIRDAKNREALWRGIQDGLIEFVVSDHSPCTAGLKCLDGPAAGDFSRAWGGIAGLQFSMSVVWTEMRNRGMSIAELSKLMSEKTALFAGLSDRKGRIAPGLDADLVIWDPEASFRVEPAAIYHRNKVTPYDGAQLYGTVHRTYVRGQCVHGEGASEMPLGKKQMRTLS